MKGNQIGRSMIEMLGVLAIIGVLSVGAIAGYQKAIMKYKLNKHMNAYNMLLNNAINISSSLPQPTSSTVTGQNTMLKKLQLIPDGITFVDKKSTHSASVENAHLEDVFKNEISFFSRSGFGYTWSVTYYSLNRAYSSDICYNLMVIAKEYSPHLHWFLRQDMNASNNTAINGTYIYGDTPCAQGKKPCLKNLTLNDISKACQISDKTFYTFGMAWNL